MSTNTPWGPSQDSKEIAPGIVFYSTASHGGIHLAPTLNAQVADVWRREEGWYEEDCDWAIVAFTFPALFLNAYASAVDTVRHWYPCEYEQVTGVGTPA